MSISLKTHKMIWGRSGNMCAFPECKKVLVVDETSTDDPSVIGEEAHIVAQKIDGPRGKSSLSLDQRDKYDNLILLCSVHHKIVDDQENEYTVQKLHEFKSTHEAWVKNNLVADPKRIKDEEVYAAYIEQFIKLSDLNNWNIWTSYMFGPSEILPKLQFESLKSLPDYIVSRIWPHRYKELESALINFKNVVNDLMKVYYEYPKERPDGYAVEKFYKLYYREKYRGDEEYSFENERRALDKYNFHVALIEDLLLELTRAGNFVCDQVRSYIFEGFRIEEGALLITRGDFMGFKTYRTEYRGEERVEFPYPGLRKFMELREQRDLVIGTGIDEDYFRKMPWES
ncbi:hypothetical protein E5K00_01895 [Hymenobacter aquaticus]|uniref:HNH endonuclease n=1 Tax=Hymenobacter aquaticus TaxID=1867101 RepID=A0A4Z0Q5N6_9BACT|nr:hypothetical protein [Hymenobacter aquaticus]TGE23992.1 hypothetical protein E5K00_01895 [Hymenobacter aquaticus]